MQGRAYMIAQMTRLFLATAAATALILAGGVAAGPLEDARTAFDAGDYARALSLWRSQAQTGNAEAQDRVGLLYLTGKGVAENDVEAVRWFRMAAQKGLADAEFNLADCYAAGHGVPQDPTAASGWYEKAAKQGHALAEFKLGVSIRKGADLRSSLLTAAEWFKKAADQGYIPAQVNLAVMFADGQGVQQDDVEAMKWLDIIARRLPDADTAQRTAINKTRAALAARMTAEQIAYAENFAAKWEPATP
jgi:TPR repeat protein